MTFLKMDDMTLQEALVEEYFTFLRFPSVSADPKHTNDCQECCQWVADYLVDAGMEVALWDTPQNPVIFAQYITPGAKGTLLLYLHYDVQPEDPLDLWISDPFEPRREDEKIYARGAADNKGQAFYTLAALRQLLQERNPAINIKLIIDGNEETGSFGLSEIIESKKKELTSDWLAIVDLGVPGLDEPAITIGMRGIITFKAIATVARHDLHSGHYGGVVDNPARALVSCLASCWDREGKIVIPGFYDNVIPLADAEMDKFGGKGLFAQGLKEVGAQRLLTQDFLRASWGLPTLEINGLKSGFVGKLNKTIIPAEATVSLSCRLVPDQEPDKVREAVTRHLREHMAEGIEFKIESSRGDKAFRTSADSFVARAARKAYEAVLGKPCQCVMTGGSIPIAPKLKEASGADVVGIGYGLASDNIHAPNEHFDLKRIALGIKTVQSFIAQLEKGA